ncbi:MAG: hypothetical protein AAF363_06970 [Bacteroidota bacterium]
MHTIKIILTFLFLFTVVTLSAQANYGITPTGKHAKYLNHLKRGKKALSKEERKTLKDSLKVWKRLDKEAGKELNRVFKEDKLRRKYNSQLEKLKAKGAPIEEINRVKEKAKFKGINLKEFELEQLSRKIQLDSSILGELTEEQLAEIEAFNEGKALLGEQSSIYKQYKERWEGDSTKTTTGQRISGIAEEEPQNQASQIKEFDQVSQYAIEAENFDPTTIGEPINPLEVRPDELFGREKAKLEEQANREELIQRAEKLLSNNETMEGVKNQMSSLKKKYSSVPNASDLSTAIKRNSMEKEQFKDRLVFGGNFQINSTDPFSIDASPTVGYMINRKWQAGFGVNYRRTFGNDSIANVAEDLWSIRTFTSYTIWKGFFGYAEYERSFQRINNSNNDAEQDNKRYEGVDAINLGLGRSFKFTRKVSGTVLLTYDLIHETGESVNRRPFNVRFGFQIK